MYTLGHNEKRVLIETNTILLPLILDLDFNQKSQQS